ncbi:MAG: hypothetical protein HYR72_12975 [Deltaproteobacteria bacterium]|nr:hypothetical protein [Deltaproteobacteria bacterium]MBI3390470.1 hypothetical protein [Deltaproteobacteria bacterium]
MPSDDNPIWHVLDNDQHEVEQNRRYLREMGLVTFIEQLPLLFDSLRRELEVAPEGVSTPLTCWLNTDGGPTPAPDFVLRVLMFQSAHSQYLHAAAHLLRGQSLELFGHARTMIENAGIAYLSRSKPELASLYLTADGQYQKLTKSWAILPKDDPLMGKLNAAFELASSMFHSNFVAVAGKIRTTVSLSESTATFENAMEYRDREGDGGRLYLRHVAWLIATTYRVLRVLAASFSLGESVWHRRMEIFDEEFHALIDRLGPETLVFAPGKSSATYEHDTTN